MEQRANGRSRRSCPVPRPAPFPAHPAPRACRGAKDHARVEGQGLVCIFVPKCIFLCEVNQWKKLNYNSINFKQMDLFFLRTSDSQKLRRRSFRPVFLKHFIFIKFNVFSTIMLYLANWKTQSFAEPFGRSYYSDLSSLSRNSINSPIFVNDFRQINYCIVFCSYIGSATTYVRLSIQNMNEAITWLKLYERPKIYCQTNTFSASPS